jgi:hypothetical protein
MTTNLTSDWIRSLLGFPFREARWREKLLSASLVAFAGFIIPILPWAALYGYFAQVARPILRTGAEPSLPDWDDWSRLLVDGFRLLGVGVVFFLPLMVLFIVSYVGMIGPAVAAGILGESGRVSDRVPVLLMALGSLGGFALFGLTMLFGLAASMVLPPAAMHVIAHEQFAAAFRLREWWLILRANLSGFLIAFALLYGLSFVAGLAIQILYFTIVLCCLMPFVLAAFSAYFTVVSAALFAQTYRAGVQRLGAQN